MSDLYLSLSIKIRGPFPGCVPSSWYRGSLISAFLGNHHKWNQGRGAPAQRSLFHFTVWKLFVCSVGKEVVIYFEVLSHLLPKFFLLPTSFSTEFYALDLHILLTLCWIPSWSLKTILDFSVLKVSLRSQWMAREPILKKPPRRILCLAHELAFGTTGLNFQLQTGRETSCVFFPWALPWAHCWYWAGNAKCAAWPQETKALNALPRGIIKMRSIHCRARPKGTLISWGTGWEGWGLFSS